MLRVLLLCMAGFGLCFGQGFKPGKCPEFTSKTDFEVGPDQEGQTCNFAEYSDNGDGTVGVHNAGLEADGTFTEIYGYVELTDVPGSLALHLDGGKCGEGQRKADTREVVFTLLSSVRLANSLNTSPSLALSHPPYPSFTVPFVGAYDVLETDYETYTSVYSCVDFLGLGYMDQAWVLGRHVLSEEELNLARSAFTRWGIDISSFQYTPQTDCSALP
ncbi:Apolipoprotein D [Portunus trituberculatus]|uniref:Apolipoprotein D n=1 Tax=Portunus trituberculatus TaxID=210409 RepID=A0A5B7F041_PORTR|nr:Apolipoprotein D [Portunus trituberculatus]